MSIRTALQVTRHRVWMPECVRTRSVNSSIVDDDQVVVPKNKKYGNPTLGHTSTDALRVKCRFHGG